MLPLLIVLAAQNPLAISLMAAPQSLSLADALKTARENQPSLHQARAQTEAAKARADQARAPLLPQVTGQASYRRATAAVPGKSSSDPSEAGPSIDSSKSYDNFSASGNVSQLIYDFGQTSKRWRASQESAKSQAQTEMAQRLSTDYNVRAAFFNASAKKSLLLVAKENLTNQDRHLAQIQGFVEVGTRPRIDLAQARTDQANAKVQQIQAENDYVTSKAQLNQAMGVIRDTDYDIGEDVLPPVSGEEGALASLVDEAIKTRPDVAASLDNIRAQELTIKSNTGGYWPSLEASAGVSFTGSEVKELARNWNAQLTLNWPIFQGGLTEARVREARANLIALQAEDQLLRQQVNLDVDQARLAVKAAVAALAATEEALANAKERLRLAEGRYAAGAGNAVELGDAQVALTSAASQRVRADFSLSTARAQLIKALGRE